ncbi:MAG: metal ABC transporter permease [Nanoarchaeota archaeon]|nr:metal ABC transporter permease [Nanoarchaeota archaeon]
MIQVILALIVAGLVGAAGGYIGSLMLTKRMSLVGGPLGHLAIPGVGLALIFGFDVSLGAGIFILFGTVLIWLLELKTKLPLEALTAIVFALSTAVFFLFIPEEYAVPALIGDISLLTIPTVIVSILLCLLILYITKKIFSKIMLAVISEDLAKAEGVNVRNYNLLYMTCIGLTIALGIRIVGGLMTAALVAIPAATSRNLSTNLKQYSYLSAILGFASSIGGVYASSITGLSAGPLIVITSALFFLLSLFFKKN